MLARQATLNFADFKDSGSQSLASFVANDKFTPLERQVQAARTETNIVLRVGIDDILVSSDGKEHFRSWLSKDWLALERPPT
jgi:hypothetical protein